LDWITGHQSEKALLLQPIRGWDPLWSC